MLFCHGLPALYIVLPWIALPCVILLYMLHCHELSVTLHCHELLCVSHLKSFPFGQHHHDSPSLPTGFFIADTICFYGLPDRFLANICVTHAYFPGIFVWICVFNVFVFVSPFLANISWHICLYSCFYCICICFSRLLGRFLANICVSHSLLPISLKVTKPMTIILVSFKYCSGQGEFFGGQSFGAISL